VDPAQARQDFMQRVEAYSSRYETITEEEQDGELTFIKLFDVGRKVVMHRCSGYLPSHIGFYLSNIHIQPRSIWLTRHAEGEDETFSGEITARGKAYCEALWSFLQKRRREMLDAGQQEGSDMLVLMGTAPVHASTFEWMSSQTASPDANQDALTPSAGTGPSPASELGQRSNSFSSQDSGSAEFPAMSTSLLNELDRGDYSGVRYAKIQRDFPQIWSQRQEDPLYFRYPGAGAESYADVIGRLRPIIIELERQRRSVLVISHLAVQRCIYGYFTGCPMEELPNLQMDMHSVIELQPGPFGSTVSRTCLDADGPPVM